MTKKDILAEIEFYEKMKITDPAGQNLYNAMIEVLNRDLAKKKSRK